MIQLKSVPILFVIAASMPFLFASCSHFTSQSGAGASETGSIERLGETPFLGTMKVHRFKLGNGLKILVLEDHAAPVFAYHTWFHVGSKDEIKGRTGLAHLFEHMMFRGTKNHADQEYDHILEKAGVEGLNAFTGRDYTGYIQSLPSDKLELIAGLEADRMRNLIVDTPTLNKEREVVQNERRYRNENSPNGLLNEAMYELAFTESPYHWPIIGYDKDLKETSAADCANFYNQYYAPNNATIIIAGDVDADRAVKVIAKHYGDLKPSEIHRPALKPEPAQTAERSTTRNIKSPVQKLFVSFHATDINGADFPALEALRSVLGEGKSSRLQRRLVDSGLATSVDVSNADSYLPGLFTVAVTLQKGKSAKDALSAIRSEIKKLQSGKVTASELRIALAQYRFNLFDFLASNHNRAHVIGFYETVGGDFKRITEIVNAVATVDPATVAGMARKYLTENNSTAVIGLPEGN